MSSSTDTTLTRTSAPHLSSAQPATMPAAPSLRAVILSASELRAWRRRLGLSLRMLAELVDYSSSSLSAWEHGSTIPLAALKTLVAALRHEQQEQDALRRYYLESFGLELPAALPADWRPTLD